MNQEDKYSIYDTQLKKITNLCNKSSISEAIIALRKSISKYDDVSDVNDKDLFNNWGYILFKHKSQINSNNPIDFSWLKKLINIKIVYSTILFKN